MKNFTKKRGLLAVAAVLLIVAAMLVTTGCGSDVSTVVQTDEFVPPAGKGAVKLNFKNETARTVLPGDDISGIGDFDQFDFKFTPTDSAGVPTGGTVITIPVDQGHQNDAIILDPGFYDVVVIAYIDFSNPKDGSDMREVAINAAAVNVQIIPAQTINAAIVLKPYSPTAGTGNGTFEYELIDSTGGVIEDATMTFYKVGTTPGTPDNIKSLIGSGPQTYTPSLQAGYYYVVFAIGVKSGDTVRFRQVIHISQNLTSFYSFEIFDTYFYATFQLREDVNNHDLTYEQLTDKGPKIEYRKGTAPLGAMAFTDYSDSVPVTVTRGQTIEFRVKNAGTGFMANSFIWYCLTDTPLAVSGDTITLTINTTGTNGGPDTAKPFSIARDYALTVVGTEDIGTPGTPVAGPQYSTDIKFTVGP